MIDLLRGLILVLILMGMANFDDQGFRKTKLKVTKLKVTKRKRK